MNEVIQPLRFHRSTDYLLKERNADIGYGDRVPLIVDDTSLCQFQINRTREASAAQDEITSVKIIDLLGAEVDVIDNLTLVHGVYPSADVAHEEYIVYKGNSTISALADGTYRLEITSNLGDKWYSDLFRIKTGGRQIKFQFTNSKTFGNLWMPGTYWTAVYDAFSFDEGGYQEYSESYSDDDNRDTYSYRRIDKIRSYLMMGDSNVMDCFKLMQMCDTVILTNELSRELEIEITEIIPEPVQRSNYFGITIKYLVIDDSIITVDKQNVYETYTQEGTAPLIPQKGIFMGKKRIVMGKKGLFK